MSKSYLYASSVLAVCLLFMLMLTGCGTNTGSGKPQETPSSAAPAASADPQAKERKIQHAKGETTVPANPARIVVLDNGALDDLLALGIKPVGAPSIVSAGAGFPSYLTNTDGIKNVGTVDQPNLEAIASLHPDLILGVKESHDAVYDKLKQIAPTVFTDTLGETWKKNLTLHADAAGKSAEGAKLLEAYQQRLTELKAKTGDQLGKTEVSLLRPRKDRIQVYLNKSFSGVILGDAGIPRPAAQRDNAFSVNMTEEQIANFDGDAIIWFGRDDEMNFFTDKIQKNPIWATLKAVKQNRVYKADWEVWMSGNGIQAANKVVDDLNKFLVK